MPIHEDLLAELLVAFEHAPLGEEQFTEMRAFVQPGREENPEHALRKAMCVWDYMHSLNPTRGDEAEKKGRSWRVAVKVIDTGAQWHLYQA